MNVPDGRVQGENEAVIAAAEKYFEDVSLDLTNEDGSAAPPFIVSVPKGRELHSVKKFLDEYLKAPERKRGTATFTTIDSFVEHVNRTKDADSLIFADDNPRAPGLLAVYDYNTAKGDPRFGQHRAAYTFPLSDQWSAWVKAEASGAMTLEKFAEFLEDRIVDVIDPATCFDSIKGVFQGLATTEGKVLGAKLAAKINEFLAFYCSDGGF